MMANIIKTISALARGYMLFAVNNKKYLTYAQALKARKELNKQGHIILSLWGSTFLKGGYVSIINRLFALRNYDMKGE